MNKNITKTFLVNDKMVERKWYLVDATDLILGRMSAVVASMLRGKHKGYFTPNVDCGDNIIIINANKIALTGNKILEREYWYTGFMGGVKFRTKGQLIEENAEKLLKKAISRMIPRGPLGRDVLRKLFIYTGNEHPHEGQKPEILDIKAMNVKNSKRN